MKKITKSNVADHVDHILTLSDEIEFGKITILTGSNGTGKSFIRKYVGLKLAEKKYNDSTKKIVASTSMEQRTGSNPEWGALAGMMRDVAWTPTSTETLQKIQGLTKIDDRYIVIDEPEIGMGEETVLAIANFLNKLLKDKRKDKEFFGVMVITHSRILVENLEHDTFVNIDGLTKEEWLNRSIKPTNLDDLEERSLLIFREIQDRINASEKKKK